MKKCFLAVPLLSLLLLLYGQSAFGWNIDACKKSCEAAETACRKNITSPNDLDIAEATEACNHEIVSCEDDCEHEKVAKEQEEKEQQEKERQEKEQEQRNRENSPFVSPQTF